VPPYADIVPVHSSEEIMLFLLAALVITSVALAHRQLQLYAPSNVLIARARIEPPRPRTALMLGFAAGAALVAMHLLAEAVTDGAPRWLNLVVLVLAWDAIRFGLASAYVALRCALGCCGWLRAHQRRTVARPRVQLGTHRV
jgi:hypothetical protein